MNSMHLVYFAMLCLFLTQVWTIMVRAQKELGIKLLVGWIWPTSHESLVSHLTCLACPELIIIVYSPIPFSLVQGGKIPYPLRSWRESPLPTEILDIVDNLGYEVCQDLLLLCFVLLFFFFASWAKLWQDVQQLTNAKSNESLLATVKFKLIAIIASYK